MAKKNDSDSYVPGVVKTLDYIHSYDGVAPGMTLAEVSEAISKLMEAGANPNAPFLVAISTGLLKSDYVKIRRFRVGGTREED